MRGSNDNSNPLIFSRGDRIAIIVILSVMAAVVAVCYLYPLWQSQKTISPRNDLDSLIMMQNAAVVEQNTGNLYAENTLGSLKPFAFNPNEMTDSLWIQLGLSGRQIKTINNYIAKGGNFKTKNDFAKLYCISDEEYEILEPYIQLPDTYTKPRRKKEDHARSVATDGQNTYKKSGSSQKNPSVVDLNAADSTLLMTLPNMNKYLASRIVRYKMLLGNFVEIDQLLEVKGLDTACFQSLVPYLAISRVEAVKINVNTFDFKALLRHPYLEYEQVKCIVNHREKRGFINNWEQLCDILDDKGEVNPRLRYYVEF